jgi:hypothetical protein
MVVGVGAAAAVVLMTGTVFSGREIALSMTGATEVTQANGELGHWALIPEFAGAAAPW